MKITFIYVLNDPRTNQIRYVGKADNPYRRWEEHCRPVKNQTYKSRWVDELRELRMTPELEILEEVPYDQWEEIEREYIRVFRMIGIRLTNTSEGGDGRVGTPLSLEHRKKISVALTGIKRSKEAVRKTAAANKGNKYCLGRRHSPGAIEKNKLAHTGKKPSPEATEKNRQAHLGKKKSLETRQRMSLAQIKRRESEGYFQA